MNLKCLSFMLVSTLYTLAAHGGPGSSGGGDLIICKGRESKIAQYYFADTYELFRTGRLDKAEGLKEEVYLNSIIDYMNYTTPGLGKEVSRRLKWLKFRPSNVPLPELDDDNIKIHDKNCYKKQLAIQILKTRDVYYDQTLLKKLSRQEIAYFKIHEALISLKKDSNDTSKIRNDLKKAINIARIRGVIENFLEREFILLPLSSRILKNLDNLLQITQKDSSALKTMHQKDRFLAVTGMIHYGPTLRDVEQSHILRFSESQNIFLVSSFCQFGYCPKSYEETHEILGSSKDKTPLRLSIELVNLMEERISMIKKSEADLEKIKLEKDFVIYEISRLGNTEGDQLIEDIQKDFVRFRKHGE